MSSPSLHVDSASVYCPLGYTVNEVTAALRAGVDAFRMMQHVDPDRNPLVGSYLSRPEEGSLLGRLTVMGRACIQDCVSKIPAGDTCRAAVILMIPEMTRAGMQKDDPQLLFRNCTEHFAFHPSSRVCALGKGSPGPALLYARSLLEQGDVDHILLAAVDSYIYTDTLQQYIQENRLLTSANSDGFIPGEGAGAVVLSVGRPGQKGLHLSGIGYAEERGHLTQATWPNRAEGLTQAIRMAVAASGRPLNETDFHCSDCSGEAFYFKESAEAILRCMERVVPSYPHLIPADCLGETGAAAAPLMLAYMNRLLNRDDAFGSKALLHWSADTGQRAAVICEWYS